MENTSLGTFIKNARMAKGESLRTCAIACKISSYHLWTLENDEHTPNVNTLKRICEHLHINFKEALVKSAHSKQIDTNPENNILGISIKNARMATGYSLRDFSSVCGVSYTHLCSIENGKSPTPYLSTLKKICSNLDDDLSDILRGAGYTEQYIKYIYSKSS